MGARDPHTDSIAADVARPNRGDATTNETGALYDEIYSPAVVMARVGHLDRTKRQDIERIRRIIREGFDGAGVLDPRPKITRIMLVGRYACRMRDRDEDAQAVPAYDFWIIVNDRLFTHKRVWQATEARITAALGDRCTVRLSFISSRGVRVGRQAGDEYITEFLDSGITLFRAKRDAPCARRGKGGATWAGALARFETAEAAFLPACRTFRDAERAYHAARADRADGTSAEDDAALEIRTGLAPAVLQQKQLGDRRHDAGMALPHTPAPDLAAIIRKLELVRDEGDGDDPVTVSILADVRWLAAREADRRRPR